MMTEIYKTNEGNSWIDGGDVFLLINRNGERIGKMYKTDLPDPNSIWERRMAEAGIVSTADPIALKLKPSIDTYKLWEYLHA